ncbi:MAG: YegS/Rv2252/BmrU family lipid kinase, partial [Planctomycetota bacterium]
AEAVVAVGGDGTVHEVANGLLSLSSDRRPALAIVPAGSGNDFAYALRLSSDFDAAVDAIRKGRSRAIDVGEIRDDQGRTRYFVNNVGTLLEGEINIASHHISWPKGSGLYYRAALQRFIRRLAVAQVELEADGSKLAVKALTLSIGNGPRSGGRFLLAPHADVADGQLDYVLLEPTGRLALLRLLHRSRQGAHLDDGAVRTGRFASLQVRSDIPIAAHVDGEPWITLEQDVRCLDLRVLPAELQTIC